MVRETCPHTPHAMIENITGYTGDDLIALGLKPGPALGALLAEIRERQLQDELTSTEQARDWVKRRIQG